MKLRAELNLNAYTLGEDGRLINEHDESGSGQEELYIVLDGKATFELDGETVDAPAGTFVFVPPESRRKATGDGTVLAVGATPRRGPAAACGHGVGLIGRTDRRCLPSDAWRFPAREGRCVRRCSRAARTASRGVRSARHARLATRRP